MSVSLRIQNVRRQLATARSMANMMDISPGKLPEDRIKERVSAIEAATAELVEALAPPKSTYPINSALARHQSAVKALASWAREVGAALVKSDSAHAMMQSHCSEADRSFWADQTAGLIRGLVGTEMKNSDLLKAEGVLAFLADPDDGYIRIVDTNAPAAHADIYRRVTEWHGGRRCRYCRIEEPPMSHELQPVEVEQRTGYHTIGGVVQLQPGVVCTHPQCRPFWLRSLHIAEKYTGVAEAQAADAAAARVSRDTPMPDFKPDAPPAPKPGWEPTRADQITIPPKSTVRKDHGG